MLSEMHISHHKRRFVPIFILICGLMAFVALSACSGEQRTASAAGPGGATGERAAAPVVVSMVEQRNIPVQLTAIGNVEAYQTVQVRSQVNGQIASVKDTRRLLIPIAEIRRWMTERERPALSSLEAEVKA